MMCTLIVRDIFETFEGCWEGLLGVRDPPTLGVSTFTAKIGTHFGRS